MQPVWMQLGISEEEFTIRFVEDHPDLTYEECAEQLQTSEYVVRRCLGLLQ